MRDRARRAFLTAAGIDVEARAERELVASGDSVPVTVTVYNRGREAVAVPYAILTGQSIQGGNHYFRPPAVVAPDSALVWSSFARGAITRPGWLAEPRVGDMFVPPCAGGCDRRNEWAVIEPGSGAQGSATVEIGDTATQLWTDAEIVYRFADPIEGDVSRPLAVAPAISVTLDRTVEYAPANRPLDRVVQVQLRSASTRSRVTTVKLQLPPGLRADSAARTVTLAGYDAQATVPFRVRGTVAPGSHVLRATAASEGEAFANGYVLVDYDHIRPIRLYRDAALTLQGVELALPAATRVAYVRGVGDNVAPALRQLGLDVTVIEPGAVATAELSPYAAVVVGPRAYESSASLTAANGRLLDYARGGGTLVVQYQQNEITAPGIAPFPLTLTRPADRVTEESAPVRVLDPAHPLLAGPNRITERDFAGWVQERSLYMPRTFDAQYTPLLEMGDPGETPSRGAVLVAPYGKGAYVYTTLSFFRQLPAGNPGAARLFVNLLGAGKVRPAPPRTKATAARAP